jgi:uncharacterized integral membrane protein (TIGR00698 family)
MRLLPGFVLAGLIALIAGQTGKLNSLAANGFGVLTISIIIGMAVGNTLYPRNASPFDAGVAAAKTTLLRLGIVLYGFRLSVLDVANVGLPGLLIDALTMGSTFYLCWIVGTRILKLDRTTTILIGAGSSICGAAAIMATDRVVAGRTEQAAVAVSTVILFGTLATFLYPVIFHLSLYWHPTTASSFGIYVGSTVHEIAQVVAAAGSVSQEASNTAVIEKMVRVMMLGPFLLCLAYLHGKNAKLHPPHHQVDKPAASMFIPWFAFGLIAIVLMNSLTHLPGSLVATIRNADDILLGMAMAALGLTTHWSAIRRAGLKPLVLGAILFGWLMLGGAAINHAVTGLIGHKAWPNSKFVHGITSETGAMKS